MQKRRCRTKKKTNFATKAIIAVYGTLIFFTALMIIVFIVKGSVPDTLITCVFGASSIECGALGWIKTTKVKKGIQNNNTEGIPPNIGE